MKNYISNIYWLWIPVVACIAQIAIEVLLPADYLSNLHAESGPHETMQALVMALAFIFSILILKKLNWAQEKIKTAWFMIAALACFYVAGEEVSWGQHIFDWITPDFWGEKNDQNETNLHNTSSWLDQKPRLILLVGITFGGLILPFAKQSFIQKLPQFLHGLIPPKQFSLIALIVLIPHIIDKIAESFDVSLFARFSEVQELFMFYFILLYLINALRNLSTPEKG